MKNNKRRIYFKSFLFILLIVVLFVSQYYGYDSLEVSEKDCIDIQNKYHLILNDENWEYRLHTKNTIINSKPSFYSFKNYYVILFDDEFTTVYIKVTDGDEIFDLVLPTFINGRFEPQVMIQENVNYNNLNIQVQLIKTCELPELEDGYYIPNYKFIFEYNSSLYHIEFLNKNNPNFVYSSQETKIHMNELYVYLSWLDAILI